MFFNKKEKEKPIHVDLNTKQSISKLLVWKKICLKILKSQEKSIIRGWDNKSSNVKKTLKALGQCMA